MIEISSRERPIFRIFFKKKDHSLAEISLTCPTVTNKLNKMAPSRIPKSLSMRNPPKKHKITFGHE
jgi:hypothetical protein